MRVYLIQHGEAKRKEEDPARPLTENGRAEVELVGRFLAEIGVKVEKIFHSGKLRAAQTAELIAKHVKHVKEIKGVEDLDPLADPKIWAEKLNEGEEDLMLVGHLPHLKKLVSLLLTGRDDLEIVKFRYGGVACLEKNEGWSLLWMIRPDILPEKG
ncbi:MAG: phosphohistidine phosphatase SixA [Thaumarchaeota archaeon]|nr:MAG: phosphohistidine phosphatase SixA [Nitrososphaerota archaeon]